MIDYHEIGFYRVAVASPRLHLADPMANAAVIARTAAETTHDLIAFPELSLTGYSCEDLFFHDSIHQHTRRALAALIEEADRPGLMVLGAPWRADDGRLFNCAFVIGQGRVLAAIPKTHLPNYGEFYEHRWFVSGAGVDLEICDPVVGEFRLCSRQLVCHGELCLGVELCEDLWAPQPPAAAHALAGANLIVNLSASDELIGKAAYRRDLVRMASARYLCAYAYAGAGPWESSKDMVFGGDVLIAEQGRVLAQGERFALQGSSAVADIDIHSIRHERCRHTTFSGSPRSAAYTRTVCPPPAPMARLQRKLSSHPFVPADETEVGARAREIMAIQSCGLARRIQAVGCKTLVLGLSGGIDSTLAALVANEALQRAGLKPAALHAVTMPGPGTTARTRESAIELARLLGANLKEIDISVALARHLQDLDHPEDCHDVVFENAQARERTQILFDMANQIDGIVVGTGDLSELALGWCTFNADQMASYNVNAGVPKTLVSYVVRWYAGHRASQELTTLLQRVLATPVSPELLPRTADGNMSQHSEDILGPYAVHDFYLYHFLRRGATPTRMLILATHAFGGTHSATELAEWLQRFLQRFAWAQFKRTTLPPGPKVGTVSLSPRGDWRMPDEAALAYLGAEVESALETIRNTEP